MRHLVTSVVPDYCGEVKEWEWADKKKVFSIFNKHNKLILTHLMVNWTAEESH